MRFCWSLALVCFSLPALAQTKAPDIARALSADLMLQGRVMWVDATANLDRITTREGVRDIVIRCKQARLTTIVVDVKPVVGKVLYNSHIAEHLTEWKGKKYPDFDVLAAFLEEGHTQGLEIAASVNVFSEGHKYYAVGPAYQRKEWQSVAYNVDRSLVSYDGSRLPIRAENEAEDPRRTTVYEGDFLVDRAPTAGQELAVELDADGRVAGIIDPALLGEEPLEAPEEGRLLLAQGAEGDWVTQHLRAGDRARFDAVGRREPVTEAATEKIAAFVNPLQPDARAHEIALLQEIARNYDVDGLVLDRMRYADLYNDYSDVTRAAFEHWLGHTVARWPEDVLRFDPTPGEAPRRGPLYKPWLEFRARVIRDFLEEAIQQVHAAKPALPISVYVGSWFPEYYAVGVNWGSEEFHVPYSWASAHHNEAGYAEFLDWLSTGCYYPIPSREEARESHKEEALTVEASADLSTAAVQNAAPVYAGVYALDYENRPDDFARALGVAARHSQGVMVFDISHIYNYGWWNILDKAFDRDAVPPHRLADLTTQVRSAEDASN